MPPPAPSQCHLFHPPPTFKPHHPPPSPIPHSPARYSRVSLVLKAKDMPPVERLMKASTSPPAPEERLGLPSPGAAQQGREQGWSGIVWVEKECVGEWVCWVGVVSAGKQEACLSCGKVHERYKNVHLCPLPCSSNMLLHAHPSTPHITLYPPTPQANPTSHLLPHKHTPLTSLGRRRRLHRRHPRPRRRRHRCHRGLPAEAFEAHEPGVFQSLAGGPLHDVAVCAAADQHLGLVGALVQPGHSPGGVVVGTPGGVETGGGGKGWENSLVKHSCM